jgi:microcin C transport system ATP-binding protein
LALALLGLQNFEGEVSLGGQAWSSDSATNKALRRQVQVVFQDPFSSLSPRMTIEEIVGEGLRVHHPAMSAAERSQQVVQTLADVGLSEDQFPGLLMRYPHEFSGGQRQRIAIARALIVQPRLLILDEPTSALDVTVQKQVLGLLQRLQAQRGLSYLLITHDVQVIEAMAHEVIVMKDGQVVEQGPALDVLSRPQHPYTRMLVESV